MPEQNLPTEEPGHDPAESTTQLTLAAAVALADDESESDPQEVSHDG